MKKVGLNNKVVNFWLQALDQYQEWLSRAVVHRHYYEGRQWTAQEAAILAESGQPVITINHIWPKVNSLVGLLLQQRPCIRALPRGRHDAELASVATKVIRYIFEVNRLQTHLTPAFIDMVTVGLGWIDIRPSSVMTQEIIKLEYVPWTEVIWDPCSRQPDFSDARFVFRGKWIDEDILFQFFPAAKRVRDIAFQAATMQIPLLDNSLEWYDQRRKRLFVLECQYKEFAQRPCFWDGFQYVRYIPEVHDQALGMGIGRIVEAKIPIVKQVIFCGDYVLHEAELPYLHGNFTLVPFVAFRDFYGRPMGLVAQLEDTQNEINKRRSKVMHYLTAKRVIAEEGAITDPQLFMEELRRPDAFLTYRKGYQVQIESDLEIGAQHFELLKDSINEMTMISGIMPDFMGEPTNARTAAALRQRVLQSQTGVQMYYSAVERGIKQLAEMALALARQYYTTERVIQLTDEPEAIVLNEPVQLPDGRVSVRNSLAALRADIVVKVQPGGATERQEQLVQLVEMLKVLPPELMLMSMDVLIDAFDIPQKNELKQRWAMLIQQMQQQQAMMPAQTQQQKGGTKNE